MVFACESKPVLHIFWCQDRLLSQLPEIHFLLVQCIPDDPGTNFQLGSFFSAWQQ